MKSFDLFLEDADSRDAALEKSKRKRIEASEKAKKSRDSFYDMIKKDMASRHKVNTAPEEYEDRKTKDEVDKERKANRG